MDPPVSNALMAALKRAQANQRRGFPDHQQQPLLAVKVDLDQLVISILDDPSVSRVMREASFSSPAVKDAIEQSINTSSISSTRLQLISRADEVKKIVEIMTRIKKRNPIVVGETEAKAVVKELLNKIESKNNLLKNISIVEFDKSKIKEVNEMMSCRIREGGVVLDLGDLKWAVEDEQPQRAVMEVTKLLARFGGSDRFWLIGTASCETYLKCRVYHSGMEDDWDLQAVPVAPRSPLFHRLGTPSPLNSLLPRWLQNAKPAAKMPHLIAVKEIVTSPVRTDLVLGRNRGQQFDKPDTDTYKELVNALMEKAWWQGEAASAVASAVARCKSGGGKHPSRGDVWLLFAGPDMVGKRKMASVLAERICGSSLVSIHLDTHRCTDENSRGKTVIDRVADAIRRNPFSVIMLEDINAADAVTTGFVKRAVERGRLVDSYGREVSLGNSVFVLSTTDPEDSRDRGETRNWQLGLIVREGSKRSSSCFSERPLKSRKTRVSLDLNLTIAAGEEGSCNSSDLTIDHEYEMNRHSVITSVPDDLLTNVDDSIMFKPVDTMFIQQEIRKAILMKFSMMMGDGCVSLEVEDDVLEKIQRGLWHDRTSLKEWIENVVAPSFNRLKLQSMAVERSNMVVRLVIESDSDRNEGDNWLPSSISV